MTPIHWFGIAIVIVFGCPLLAFSNARERRRKARRQAFLRNQQYHDHARRRIRRSSRLLKKSGGQALEFGLAV
jgi:hypothetical protein